MGELPAKGTVGPEIAIRPLAPGDEAVVRGLATYDGPGDPEALLADPRTLMLVAFEGGRPVGFVLAHELPRRHGERSKDVAETHRRSGIAFALLGRVAELARERGSRGERPLPKRGGTAHKDVMWEFAYEDA